MQPTVGAELAGARRSLSTLAATPDLPPDLVADVADVIRKLRRVETVWSQVLPYLVADNARMEQLLMRLGPLVSSQVPPDVVAAVDDAVAAVPAPGSAALLDVEAVNERNEALRGVLSRLIATAPPNSDDATVRSMIVACLRESLDARPF